MVDVELVGTRATEATYFFFANHRVHTPLTIAVGRAHAQ
jgi:hypothetical protein